MEKSRQKRSIVAILIALLLACSIAGLSVMLTRSRVKASAEVSVWDGDLIAAGWGKASLDDATDAPAGYTETGESGAKVIEIDSADALAYFSRKIYLDTAHDLNNATVNLMTDIDLDNHMWVPIGQTSRGSLTRRFSGTFNGNGHTIRNFSSEEFFNNLKHKSGDEFYVEYTPTNGEPIELPFLVKANDWTDDAHTKPESHEYSYGLFATAEAIEIKDLTMENVSLSYKTYNFTHTDSLSENGFTTLYVERETCEHDGGEAGATRELTPGSVGALIGYAGTGKVTLTNCIIGSEGDQLNAFVKATNASVGGIVGKAYSGTSADITFTGCKNYMNLNITHLGSVGDDPDVTYNGAIGGGNIGGLLGYTGTTKKNLTFENCVNYGDVLGGTYIGGMTSYYYPQNGSGFTDKFLNCDNYGNIVSKTASEAGGISNLSTNYGKATLIVSGCNNYGNVGAKVAAGGIFGIFSQESADATSTFTNNYNYGDIYCYGEGADNETAGNNYKATAAGGLIGYMYYGGTATTFSGGSVGTIHVGQNVLTARENRVEEDKYTAAIGSVIGATGLKATSAKFTTDFIADAGSFKVYDDNTEVPDAEKADLSNISVRKAAVANDGTFNYADEGRTEIIGLVNGDSAPATLEIPETVETIGFAAFAGYSEITAIDWADSNVTEIGDFAFAGTGIKVLTLPAGIEKLGHAAFADCEKLNNVILPEGAVSVSLGANVFDATRDVTGNDALGALLIAKSNAEYQALAANESWAQSGGVLTHTVTINYVYDGDAVTVSGGEEAYTEVRLHGLSYGYTLGVDGQWTSQTFDRVGPSATGYQSTRWYTGVDKSYVVTDQNVNNLLLSDADSITLYGFNEAVGEGKKEFIVRSGVVFDESMTYTVNELNMLLHPLSDRIDSTMAVTINGSAEGTIHDAGEYTIKVTDGDDVYTFVITIEKATLDLANLSNLEWRIDKGAELRSETLYVYTYKTTKDGHTAGDEYPSLEILSAEQIAANDLNNSYEVRSVVYSVTRFRGAGENVTITLNGNGYTPSGLDGNSFDIVGKHTATVTLTADENHVFTVGNISAQRGLTIDLDGNTTAHVSKVWYIVDVNNMLIMPGTTDEYTISGHTYNGAVSAVAPILLYGTSSHITMHLFLNGNRVGGTQGFGTDQFDYYINNVMPAGTYTLQIDVDGFTTEEPVAEGSEEKVEVYHSAFSETYTFVVAAKALPSAEAIDNVLKGQTFEFADTSSSLYNDPNEVISGYLGASAHLNVQEFNTFWGENYSTYSSYYTGYVITFNIAGNDVYSSATDENFLQRISQPATYTVYYQISAPSYVSSIDGVSRYDYSFELVKYHVVDLPNVSSDGLVYTGSRVVPTLTENSWYEIIWSTTDTYITGGAHSVSFKLYDTDHYRWAGHEDDGVFTISKDFTIAKAENVFTVSLNMLGWSFETFDAAVNNIRAAVRFLDEGETIHFRVVKKGETTALTGLADFTIDENGKVNATVAALLNALRTGEYTLYASVAATGNYQALELNVDFAVSKAMNSWAVGDEDLVLPSWIVGQYDPEVNLIVVNAAHGTVNIIIEDIDGNEYYNSVTGVNNLNELEVGKYLLKAWVDESDDYASLAERTFTIEVFKKVGLPWWATLCITVGALAIAALIIFILWKAGVFQIVTEKIVVALRTRASVEATIASVRAAKRMEEGKKSVAEAKRKERLEQMRQKAQEIRDMSPEDRAAYFEAKAQADAERAEKMRARSEAALARAAKARGAEAPAPEAPVAETPAEEAPEAPETPTEE